MFYDPCPTPMFPTATSKQSTNAMLSGLGYTTEPAKFQGCKNILDNGVIVFSGDCFMVNDWINEMTEDCLDDLRC